MDMFGGLAALSGAFNIAKEMLQLRDAIKLGEAQVALYREIGAASLAYQNALDTIAKQKEQISKFEKWESEKVKRRLKDFGGKTFAYAKDEKADPTEPEHCLCANCFDQSQKSILQFLGKNALGQQRADCPRCETKFSFGEARQVENISTTRLW